MAMGDVTFDEALVRRVGQFGPGQWRIVITTSLLQVPNALAFLLWVFLAADPIASRAWSCTHAADAACAAVAAAASPLDAGFCALPRHAWHWTSTGSLAARFDLMCDMQWRVQLANTFMFAGSFLGSGVFGMLCDRCGRRPPLFGATAIVAASVFASLAAKSYWAAVGARAAVGLGAAGQAHAIFLLCAEVTGPDFRGRAGVLSLLLFCTGEFLLVGLAALLPDWRHLTMAAGAINAAALLLLPAVPESGRYLLSAGRRGDAEGVLAQLAAANGGSMPPGRLVCSHEECCGDGSGGSSRGIGDGHRHHGGDRAGAPAQVDTSAQGDAEVGAGLCAAGSAGAARGAPALVPEAPFGLRALLSTHSLRVRAAVLLCCWYILMQAYYGLSLGAGGIPGSLHVTFALGAAAEVVALLVAGPAVDSAGRRAVVAGGLLACGGTCIACARLRGALAQAILAAIAKFGCSVSESVIAVYSSELLPTRLRSRVMAVLSQASRIGAATAPFLLMAGAATTLATPMVLPFSVFGSLSLAAGLAVLLLPETLGAPMPETLQDLQRLRSLFSERPWRQGLGGMLRYLLCSRAHQGGPDGAPAAAGAAHGAAGACLAGKPSGDCGGDCRGDAAGGTDSGEAVVVVRVAASPAAALPQAERCGAHS